MAEPAVDIPNRAAFKASEVCEIARIPTYVLRSWEKEFPRLGVESKPGGSRVYRRADVEQILRIRQLVFAEGLTLAGARRRLEGEPVEEEPVLPLTPLAEDVRTRVAKATGDLRALLEWLSTEQAAAERPRPAEGGKHITGAAGGEREPDAEAQEPDAEAQERASSSSAAAEHASWPPASGARAAAGKSAGAAEPDGAISRPRSSRRKAAAGHAPGRKK